MVFPHRIASPKTIGLLKKYNFLATANLDNNPSGHDTEKTFNLFSGILSEFGNFPSLKRHVANMDARRIAIDSFFGSPILLCAHHDFSTKKLDVAETARTINRIQPQTEWKSLGYISKRLYLQKLRDDGDYDVISFASNFMIRNTQPRNITYFIRKEESFEIPIKMVKLNDDQYSYEKSESALFFRVDLLPFESAHIVIEYENDLDLAAIPTLKDNFRVSVLRWSSDIRDLFITRSAYGQFLVRSYYDTGFFRLGLMGALPTLLLGAIALSAVLYWAKNRLKR